MGRDVCNNDVQMRIEELGVDEWGNVLPERGFGVFHTPEALTVLDHHSPGELRLFGGFRGEEPIGLFPVHIRSNLGARLLTSPPLGFGIGRLGPVLMPSSPKQQKQESTNKEFVREVLDAADADGALTLLRMACSTRYTDPRPFSWSGFDITPLFTYRLDLSDTESDPLLDSFSRDLRTDIRKRDEVEFTIRTAGMDAAGHTYQSVTSRYSDQDLRVPLTWEFVRDLLESLDEERSRVYVAETTDGEFISGMILLYSNDTAYFWKGGAKAEGWSVSPNSLLHWRVIEDILTDPELASIEAYDLYTANNERLVDYKSRFGGSLTGYYVVESNNVATTVAKKLYRTFALGKDPFSR